MCERVCVQDNYVQLLFQLFFSPEFVSKQLKLESTRIISSRIEVFIMI